MPIHDAAGLARAERALHLVLRSESDSRLDRVLHRPYSRWLTRLLSATPATPNQVTLASLHIGALAIWCFWHATPSTVLWGILLYWLANVVDHSDGELARHLADRRREILAEMDAVVAQVPEPVLDGREEVGT